MILIDGSGLIYRGFYAIPPFLKAPDGTQTNAVFGFTTILISILASQKPDYLAVAMDKKGPTFRHKEFKEYKATRVKAPQELYDQIPLVKEVINTFKIPLFEADGFEADDVIAAIVARLKEKKDIQTFIATGDFDMFQVVNPNVFILYPAKGFKGAEILKTEDIVKKYNLYPEQIPDYKGLAGDSSDNIPGVKGIGDKGATELLLKYKNLENIYEHLDEIGGAVHKKLEVGRESAFMSKRLATLDPNAPVDFDLAACHIKDFDVSSAQNLFGKLGFKSLQKRLDELFNDHYSQSAMF